MNLHAGLHHEASRAWSEPSLHANQLVYPIFVTDKVGDKEIPGFEPNMQWGKQEDELEFMYSSLVLHLRDLVKIGLKSVMIFGVISNDLKDDTGSFALDPRNPSILATKVIKEKIPGLQILLDVCVDEYTSHGHCGALKTNPTDTHPDPIIDNQKTIDFLAKMSLAYAESGAHYVCPSDMMDQRVDRIRKTLDSAGFRHVGIMSYTSKKASTMYSPFRLAVDSTFEGDRKRYQQPIGSITHARQALVRDLEEGATVVLVKPALFYGDIISDFKRRMREGTVKDVPIACYIVSGEYVMLKKYGEGCNSLDQVIRESHLSMLRSGADILITYFTPRILNLLKHGNI